VDLNRLIPDQSDEGGHQHSGCAGVPPVQAAVIAALAQDVSEHGTQRAGEDERDPEQQHPVGGGEIVGGKQGHHDRGEQQCSAPQPKPCGPG